MRPISAAFGFALLAALPFMMGAATSASDRGCETSGEIELWFGCPNDGRIYLDSLVSALDAAERVVITEHSDPLDLGKPKSGEPPRAVFEYRRVELDAARKESFRQALSTMSAKTQSSYSACIPVVHHTVRFEAGDRVLGTLRICFTCSQIFWDGTDVRPPAAIYSALSAVVKESGLEPQREMREWHQLASEAFLASK